MRLGKLRARNFRSFNDETVDFAQITQATITGDNGAGKSSLVVDAPLWALFGRAHLDLDSVVGNNGDTATVDLEVRNGDESLLVTRTRKRGSTSTLTVKRKNGDAWEPVVAGVKEAQEYIDQHLMHGRTYTELVASVYMVQGNHSAFTKATQAEAKDIFTNLLALSRWQARALYAKSIRVGAEARVSDAEQKLEYLPTIAPDAYARIAELEGRIENLRPRVTEATENTVKRQHEAQSVSQVNAAYAELERRVYDIGRRYGEASLNVTSLRLALDGFDDVPDIDELEAQRAQLHEQRVAHEKWASPHSARTASLRDCRDVRLPKAQAELERQEARLTDLDASEAPTCFACHQDLVDPAALSAAREVIIADIDAAKLTLRTITSTIESDEKALAELGPEPEYNEGMFAIIERRIAQANEHARATANYEAASAQLSDLEAARTQAQADLAAAPKPQNAEEVEARYLDARVLQKTLEDELAQTVDELATLKGMRTRAEEAAAKRTELETALEVDRAELAIARDAERAFGRDGIPAYLVDAVLPNVEDTANQLLEMMSEGTLSTRLSTEKELKTGETRSALNIMVSDGVSERAFSTFSGGEAFRINFALRVALAEMVAHRSGLDLSMLVIDEPEGLDAGGRTALIQALGVIEPRFDTIVLVSHHEDLREALPQQVIVKKAAAGSTVSFHE